jgi:hypothetical protein
VADDGRDVIEFDKVEVADALPLFLRFLARGIGRLQLQGRIRSGDDAMRPDAPPPAPTGVILAGTSLPLSLEADLTLDDQREVNQLIVSSSLAGVLPAVFAEARQPRSRCAPEVSGRWAARRAQRGLSEPVTEQRRELHQVAADEPRFVPKCVPATATQVPDEDFPSATSGEAAR